MSKDVIKVAVTGAAGQIGYALLFRIASGQMFGKEKKIQLQLIEIEKGLPTLEGVVMELEDCAFPLLEKIVYTADLKTGMDDIHWAILVGATPRKEGMERSDLLKINGGIFTAQGKAINDYANDDVRVFVVGNPCNTNCLIAMHSAPDVARDRFFAMTMLDENRARSQLAKKAGVPVRSVTNMAVWGNHSSTQYPDFYQAKIDGKPATEVITDHQWLQNDFVDIVQKRGATVIKARGASSAASAASSVIDSVHHLTHDTKAGDWFSVCRHSKGEYGVDEGLIFSYPCTTKQEKTEPVMGLPLNEFSQKKFAITLDELRAERAAVKELGLIGK